MTQNRNNSDLFKHFSHCYSSNFDSVRLPAAKISFQQKRPHKLKQKAEKKKLYIIGYQANKVCQVNVRV